MSDRLVNMGAAAPSLPGFAAECLQSFCALTISLGRAATGRTVATYRAGDGSRDGLMLDPVFAAAFVAAKERIRRMEYRCVEEADQNRQARLEIYCAVVLGTPYNDFRYSLTMRRFYMGGAWSCVLAFLVLF